MKAYYILMMNCKKHISLPPTLGIGKTFPYSAAFNYSLAVNVI